MPEFAHRRGSVFIAGVGEVDQLKTFNVEGVGDPTILEALEGSVGSVDPKGKRLKISITVFNPQARHVYSKVWEYWKSGAWVEVACLIGTKYMVIEAQFNAPKGGEDGIETEATCEGPILGELRDIT